MSTHSKKTDTEERLIESQTLEKIQGGGIKVGFSDISPEEIRLFDEWVKSRGHVRSQKKPDILIHAAWGIEHLQIPSKFKISYTEENLYPNFNIDHYAISHLREDISGRNLYYPYLYRVMDSDIRVSRVSEKDVNRKFAIFIASQDYLGDGARLRREFVEYVIKYYKHVDCPGRILHNMDIPELEPRMGAWREGKFKVLPAYKFNICFENANSDGYITEKLVDSFMCNTVPIYWGSEGNVAPFPKDAMICANDYADFESLLARVREVDENKELYMNMLLANPLRDSQFLSMIHAKKESLYDFLDMIANRVHNGKLYGLNEPSIGTNYFDATTYLSSRISSKFLKRVIKVIPFTLRRKLRNAYINVRRFLLSSCKVDK